MQLTIWEIARMCTDTSNSVISTRDATGITSKVTRMPAKTNRCNCSRLSSFIFSMDNFFLIYDHSYARIVNLDCLNSNVNIR